MTQAPNEAKENMEAQQAKREIINYEYLFQSTPRFAIADENWQLHDVFIKYLENGHSIFVTVFRKRIAPGRNVVDNVIGE